MAVTDAVPSIPGLPPDLPSLRNSVQYIEQLGKSSAVDVLSKANDAGVFALQPRCGVGGHDEMRTLLGTLEHAASPDILSLTIDSHTRLQRFDSALRSLNTHPGSLNGYPLVTHGWRRGRELNEHVSAPLEIRHGSPDARALFEVAAASGITSFEGGGISYNLPYSKDVPLATSIQAWQDVDCRCGEFASHGIIIDRELFGTLTAVLIPPSISLAISVIEALLATAEGVACISVAYPQGGHLEQDVAALQAIPILADRYLPPDVSVFSVLHEFMGAFPGSRSGAESLILYGAFAARLGGADKLITKTHQEAVGIPDATANADGIRLARLATSPVFDFVGYDKDRVNDELRYILDEVDELLSPLDLGSGLRKSVTAAFEAGQLDIPFSASVHARSAVVPRRDSVGAIRYHDAGNLSLSDATRRRHHAQLDTGTSEFGGSLFTRLTDDINHFVTMLDC
ncbi:methylaspartate mutase [Rhodococcus sp. 1R11]|uniref:methylaspartate mutase n=1 Tax=Rhodococcus sp. 1R11 TaxID=2559614 RepID=UPI001072938F|nr:methylaspartate mutase [Rhodococcus sp. 1R11]TFI43677.1 methylaspartate mutase [Rhodococcus sp. 1R11]